MIWRLGSTRTEGQESTVFLPHNPVGIHHECVLHVYYCTYSCDVCASCSSERPAQIRVSVFRPGSVKRPLKMLCLVRCFVFCTGSPITGMSESGLLSMALTVCLWGPLLSFCFLPRIPRQHCHVNFGETLDLVTVLGLDMFSSPLLLGFHLSPSLHLHAD